MKYLWYSKVYGFIGFCTEENLKICPFKDHEFSILTYE